MAGEKLGYVYSAYAGSDLTGEEGTFVKISGAVDGLPIVTAATDSIAADGVILRGDVKDATVRIGNQGIVMVVVGVAVAAGAAIEVASAKAITKAAGVKVGTALSAGAAGDMIPVLLV